MGVERVLQKHDIDFKPVGTYLQVRCLSPDHEDRNPSMFVNQYSGWANCKSCGASLNVFQLFGEKSNWLQIRKDQFREKMKRKGMEAMSYEIPDNAVLHKAPFRGVSAETIMKFEAFQYNEFPGYLFFPIRSASGKIVNFIGRDTTGTRKPKYFFLYKRPIVMAPYSEPYYGSIILVEGWFDFLNLYEKGLTNVRSLFGTTTFGEEQIEQLKMQSIDEVVIMMDGDEAGQKASARIKDMLDEAYISNKIIKLPQGTDPGELQAETVTKIKDKLYGKQSSDSRDEAVLS